MIEKIIKVFKDQGIEVNSKQSDLLKEIFKKFSSERSYIDKLQNNKTEKRSFYIWGNVGRGKTLITTAFFNTLKEPKKSFHYIDFMQYVHNELSNLSNKRNPLDLLTKSLAKKYKVIYIDEFQVEDITDAMIIGNLLNQLIKSDITLYLTSNAHPEDLYKNGLQRENFIKNMRVLAKSLNIYMLEGATDYRTKKIIDIKQKETSKIYNDDDIISIIEDNFKNTVISKDKFTVNSKDFSCNALSNQFLWISFDIFFKEANGSKDYIEISRKNEWIFISDFMSCDDHSADMIRRFISFIDICYRDKTKVKFFLKNYKFKDLYVGDKLEFLWNRCCSRLNEMQNEDYLL